MAQNVQTLFAYWSNDTMCYTFLPVTQNASNGIHRRPHPKWG